MRRAYSSGVASHGCTAACAAAPSRSASARSESTRTSASASAVGVFDRNEKARRAILHDVGDAADPAPDHTAAAAERLDDDATEALRTGREHEGRSPRRAHARPPGWRATRSSASAREARDEALEHVAQRPAPDEVKRRVGHARGRAAPGLGEDVDGLVALEHADEERDRALGQRAGSGTRRTARGP